MQRRRVLGLVGVPTLGALAALAPAPATARSVALAGQMGRKALLIVDGQTVTLAVGETRHGVRLHALADGRAEVEVDGRLSVLHQGAAPISVGAQAGGPARGREIVLPVGPGGHFIASGSINGRPVRFMVDTGATVVALSDADAARIGLDLARAPAVPVGTAGGPVMARQVTLSAVTLGDVVVANVAAVVLPTPMTHVLLGNSFLQRFQMRRENDLMRLELR